MIWLFILALAAACVALGWLLASAPCERMLLESQALRDEAWDLVHGPTAASEWGRVSAAWLVLADAWDRHAEALAAQAARSGDAHA